MDHFLLLYEYVEDMAQRRAPHRDMHLAHIRAARDAGQVSLAGGLGEPVSGGAIVFTGVAEADVAAFADADPYTQAGLIRSRRILPWKLV